MADRPYLVGFAAEVGSIDAAVDKAVRKGVDLLVANDVARPGSGFGTETDAEIDDMLLCHGRLRGRGHIFPPPWRVNAGPQWGALARISVAQGDLGAH